MKIYHKILYILLPASLLSGCARQSEWNVTDFGAVGDGITLNTQAIQRAVDECHAAGGGTVLIPKGVFVSGTIYMKDHVELHIEEGSTLKGSSQWADYPDNDVKYVNSFTYSNGKPFANKALIFGEGVNHISITGKGTIDGSGDSPEFQLGNDSEPMSRNRPSIMLFLKSTNLQVHDLTLTNSAYWVQNYLGCDTLHLKGLTIYNHTNFNQDATDIDSSNVLIEECVIDSDDDGICLKSHDPDRVVENVTVRNCIIASNCNAIKFGTKSEGGFRNITITDCKIRKSAEDHIRKWQENLEFIELPTTVIAGIALESVDGGVIENVRIADIEMQDVQTPIFVILGRRSMGESGSADFYNSETVRADPALRMGKVSGLVFENITATSHSKMTSSVSAVPGVYVEDVTFRNIRFSTMGHGTKAEAAAPFTEYIGFYPENRMYGYVYPSSGLFLRHIKNVRIENMELELRHDDYRPAVQLEDVHGFTAKGVDGTLPAGNAPFFRISDSRNITLEKTPVNAVNSPLLNLNDTNTAEITIL